MDPLTELTGRFDLFRRDLDALFEGVSGLGQTVNNVGGDLDAWDAAINKLGVFSLLK